MLTGRRVVLRPMTEADVRVLYPADTDPVLWATTAARPWRPLAVEAYVAAVAELAARPDVADFVVAVDDRPVGYATVWGIDEHNRIAHAGLVLVDPADRGAGLGRDALALLSVYAFVLRDLARLTVETHTDNEPMIRAALAVGYRREGVLREHEYALGGRRDVALLGLLRADWVAAGGAPEGWAGRQR